MLAQMPGYYSPAPITRAELITILGGAPGILYDPSDSATVFQERTGALATTPAGADDPVGTILDVSGNGYHATAPSDAARPIRKTDGTYWRLEFDGVDDCLIANDYQFLNESNFFVSVAYRSTSVSPTSGDLRILEIGSLTTDATRSRYGFLLGGKRIIVADEDSGIPGIGSDSDTYKTNPGVLSARLTGELLERWDNGTNKLQLTPAYMDLDAQPGKNRYPLTIGRLSYISAQFAAIEVYGVVFVEGTAQVRAPVEQWLARKSGVTL